MQSDPARGSHIVARWRPKITRRVSIVTFFAQALLFLSMVLMRHLYLSGLTSGTWEAAFNIFAAILIILAPISVWATAISLGYKLFIKHPYYGPLLRTRICRSLPETWFLWDDVRHAYLEGPTG